MKISCPTPTDVASVSRRIWLVILATVALLALLSAGVCFSWGSSAQHSASPPGELSPELSVSESNAGTVVPPEVFPTSSWPPSSQDLEKDRDKLHALGISESVVVDHSRGPVYTIMIDGKSSEEIYKNAISGYEILKWRIPGFPDFAAGVVEMAYGVRPLSHGLELPYAGGWIRLSENLDQASKTGCLMVSFSGNFNCDIPPLKFFNVQQMRDIAQKHGVFFVIHPDNLCQFVIPLDPRNIDTSIRKFDSVAADIFPQWTNLRSAIAILSENSRLDSTGFTCNGILMGFGKSIFTENAAILQFRMPPSH